MRQSNFGMNLRIDPEHFYAPRTEAEVLDVLDEHPTASIRCIGRKHSWSQVLHCDEVLLDLRLLDSVQVLSGQSGDPPRVEVGAGCQVKRLLHELREQGGYTLPSVGFITEQTVAGATATGTHGSGKHSLSHYVTSVRLATYDPATGNASIKQVDAGNELRAARCSLGCMGVVVSVTLECRKIYAVEEQFREYSDLSHVLAAESQFPLQQFYLVPWRWTYFAQHRRECKAARSRLLKGYHWYRFLVFDVFMHWLILFCVRLCRAKFLIKGLFRWLLPLFVIRNWRVVGDCNSQLVMEHELFRHIELELFVQAGTLSGALRFLQSSLELASNCRSGEDLQFESILKQTDTANLADSLRGTYTHHYPICVRRILPDDTLISMASGVAAESDNILSSNSQIWYSITLTNYDRGVRRERFERVCEFLTMSMYRAFAARPHWGKLCYLSAAELCSAYPRFACFAEICQKIDPQHRFSNDWTRQLLEHSANAVESRH